MAIGGTDSTEVRLAPNGNIFVANSGTAAPTDVTSALSSSWVNLGFASEDGVTLTHGVDTNDIMGWQSGSPLKTGLSGVSLELKFKLLQTNKEVTALYWAGSSWTNGAAGIATLGIPSAPSISSMEHAMVIEYTDDAGKAQRLYCGRGIITDREDIELKRDDAVMYGVTFRAFDNNGSLASLLSNSNDLYSS